MYHEVIKLDWGEAVQVAHVTDFIRYCAYGNYFCILQTEDIFFVYSGDNLIFWCLKTIDTSDKTLVEFNFHKNEYWFKNRMSDAVNDIHHKRYMSLVTVDHVKFFEDRQELFDWLPNIKKS